MLELVSEHTCHHSQRELGMWGWCCRQWEACSKGSEGVETEQVGEVETEDALSGLGIGD